MKKFLHLILLFIGILGFINSFAQINTGGTAKVPFGKNTAYKYGIMPANLPSGGTYGGSADAASAYNAWKTAYVRTDCGSGKARVLFDDGSSTVSEGIGYGMLLSVYAADKATFDGLWAYYQANMDGNGMMNWKIGGCSGATGQNGATDAELDVAMALTIAVEQWPANSTQYTADAKSMIQKIKNLEMDGVGQTLNGDAWGNTNSCRNPSYFAPGYYTEFAKIDAGNASFWNTTAINASNTVLTANRNATSGLVSNWCDNSGTENSCGNTGSGANGYGADACRNPWRMAIDYLWHGTSASTAAKDINAKLTAFVNGYENQLKGPFSNRTVSNPSGGSYINGSYSTFALSPMTSSSSQNSLNKCYTTVSSLANVDAYFNSTIRCISMFVLSGNFWAPGASGFVFPPTVSTAVTNADGTQIILTTNKALSSTTAVASKFTYYLNGTAQAASAITAVAISGSTITLTVSVAPQPGQTIALSYDGTGNILSTESAVMAAFTKIEVLNMLAGNETILDDCDDGNELNNVGGIWFTFNDMKDQNGACKKGTISSITPLSSVTSPYTMSSPGYNGSAFAVKANYTLGANYTPYNGTSCATWTNPAYVGIGTYVDDVETNTMDWTSGTGVSFMYKGPATTFQVIIKEVTDYAYHAYNVTACSDWTKQTVLWASLTQPTWTKSPVKFSAVNVQKLQWQFAVGTAAGQTGVAGSTGSFWIDDVRIMNMPPVPLTSMVIGVNPKSKITDPLTLTKTSTDTLKLVITPTPATASYPVIFWSSSDTTVVKVDYLGNIKVIGYGTAVITARSKMHQSITATYTVKVPAPKVNPTSISFTPTTYSVNAGSSTLLIPTFAPTGVTETGLTWVSSNLNVATVGTDGTVTGVTAGTVTITATSTAVTSVKATATVTVIASCAKPTVTITPSAATLCKGISSTLTASGNAGTYLWSTGATTAAITVTPTANTTYSVTGTSATGGCTTVTTQDIVVNAVPTIALTAAPTICAGATATLTASGATSYSWSNNITTASNIVNPAVTTTYLVTGTSNNCASTASTSVTVNSLPTIAISPANPSICPGTAATITASGATTYAWNNGTSTAANIVTPTITTTYSVTGTDSKTCKATASVAVTVNSSLSIIITPSSPSICTGATATLTASGASSYVWNNASSTPAISINPTATTIYTVTGSDASGCKGTATSTIVVNAQPTVTIGTLLSSKCTGTSATISASGASSYIWGDATTLASFTTILKNTTTTYTVTGTDTKGCKASATNTVTIGETPTIVVNPTTATICTGSNTTLSASGSSSYIWSNGLGVTASVIAAPTVATTYTVTGSNASGCFATATATVAISSSLTVSITPATPSICTGESVLLTGNGATNYSWSNSGTGISQTVKPTVTTTYSVTGTDAKGCSGTGSAIVKVNSLPTITISPIATICAGGSKVIQVSGASTYNWNNAGNGTSQNVTPLISTIYTVTGTDANACQNIVSTTVIVNAVPTITLATTKNAICNGETTKITASGATSYIWNNNITVDNISVTPNTTTTYSVTGTQNSCSATASTTVIVNTPTTSTITVTGCKSVLVNNTPYTTSGTYSQTIKNIAGCDSIITIIASITQSTASTITDKTCNSSYKLNTETYTQSGTYTQTLQSKAGCDSVITLNLTINKPTTNDITQISSSDYTLNSTTYNKTGDYTQTLINKAGCDSIINLHLTIQSTKIDTTVTACEKFNFNGTNYTTSGDYNVSANITLHLTILAATKSTVTTTSCDSYTLNSTIYKQSGVFTQTIPNKAGCDSIITLNLTINNSVKNSFVASSCGDYTWNGKTYSTSGSYTQTLKTKTNCDSVVTLSLTVKTPTTSSIKKSICESFTLNNQTYTTSGTFTQKLTNKAGCDSTITLDLTILKSTASTINAEANGSYSLNGKTYTIANTYTQTVINKAGCDSIITIILKMADLTVLNKAIDSASLTLSSAIIGTDPGQYPSSAQVALQTAITQAKGSAANVSLTQKDIDAATKTLLAEISNFKASINGSVNKTDLNATIALAKTDTATAVIGTNPGNYSQLSVTTLANAIKTAQTVADNVAATSAEVNTANQNLKTAITTFLNSAIGAADKSVLNTTITTANTDISNAKTGDHPGQYSATSIKTLTDAVTEANKVSINTTASQQTVDAATKTLQAAIDAFVLSVVGQPIKTTLNQTITSANAVTPKVAGDKPGNYPADAITTFNQAIADAQVIYDSKTASQSEVDAANTALVNAIALFKSKAIAQPDKSALNTSILNAQAIANAAASNIGSLENQYPQTAYNTFTLAITKALGVYNGTTYSVTDVATAKTEIDNAIKAFQDSKITTPTIDKSKLIQAIGVANDLTSAATSNIGDHPGQYTSASISELNKAIIVAQTIQGKSSATQLDIDNATTNLLAAIDTFKKSIVGQPNKTDLNKLIISATTLFTSSKSGDKPGQYPAFALTNLSLAIDAATKVNVSTTNSQSEVTTATTALQSAIDEFLTHKVGASSYTTLESDITSAQSLLAISVKGNKPTQYPSTVFTAFEKAISDALIADKDKTLSQSEVSAADEALLLAIQVFKASQLPLATNKADLQIKITEAEGIYGKAPQGTKPNEYPKAAKDALNAAISHALKVYGADTTTNADVINEITALETAITKFNASIIPMADKSKLVIAIDYADSKLNGVKIPQDYPKTAVDELNSAINKADSVNSSSKATQAEVDAEVKALNDMVTLFLLLKTPNGTGSDIESIITKVGPNPVIDIVTITSTELISSIEIYNSMGQKIERTSVNGNSIDINISELPTSEYFVRITLTNGSTIIKTIIK